MSFGFKGLIKHQELSLHFYDGRVKSYIIHLETLCYSNWKGLHTFIPADPHRALYLLAYYI
jgi:hypothetical protein